jgi:hypothetical protein
MIVGVDRNVPTGLREARFDAVRGNAEMRPSAVQRWMRSIVSNRK